jgi:hypothetical protein
VFLPTASPAHPAADGDASPSEELDNRRLNAVTVFGGRLTDNKWMDIALVNDVRLRDSYMVGGALTREVLGTSNWAIELEGQIVRHFGDQDNWEFNGVALARWRAFPWNGTLPTSVAFGFGPSYATEVPEEEARIEPDSARLLVYWTFELELGLPEFPWSAMFRLHHRSAAYGVVAEDGSSNILALGLRYRF